MIEIPLYVYLYNVDAMKYLLPLFALLATLSANAQEISGNIKDNNKDALCSASVTVIQGGIVKSATVTDTLGNYRVKNLEPGYYDVSVSYPGYKTRTTNRIIVVQGETTGLNASLIPENYQEIYGQITRCNGYSGIIYTNSYISVDRMNKTVVAYASAMYDEYKTVPLEPGKYRVTLTCSDYSIAITEVVIIPEKPTELNFNLCTASKKNIKMKYKKYIRRLRKQPSSYNS